MSPADHSQLVELMVAKDTELKSVLQLASEQAKIEQNMNSLRAQVAVQDEHIMRLQKQLKEAEQILSTALFQAKQKLNSIKKANDHKVSSEELIKYAYRISASNAVCAPLTWQQGDLRRPYPTDIEMRLGFLGKSDLNLNGHSLQHQNSVNEVQRNATGSKQMKYSVNNVYDKAKEVSNILDIPASAQNQFAWHPSGELHMTMSSGNNSVSLDTR